MERLSEISFYERLPNRQKERFTTTVSTLLPGFSPNYITDCKEKQMQPKLSFDIHFAPPETEKAVHDETFSGEYLHAPNISATFANRINVLYL